MTRDAKTAVAYATPNPAGTDDLPASPPLWNQLRNEAKIVERGAQVELYLCICGAVATADAAWLTPTVSGLADTGYDDRDWAPLPLLADALEDAGCGIGDLSQHLRGDG